MKPISLEVTMMKRIGELNKENARLKAEVERLTQAGDELHVFLISYIVENRISSSYLDKLENDWYAAKEARASRD